MTDEEFGRVWATQQGKVAGRLGTKRWYWSDDDDSPEGLGWLITIYMDEVIFADEAAAYEQLGRAIRRIHEYAPPKLNQQGREDDVTSLLGFCKTFLPRLEEALAGPASNHDLWVLFGELEAAVKVADTGGGLGV